ncbi:MAG: CehA/McbA family metallohydrolase [Chitinispirillaceae bacterium]|nr:CehA/McbA family metallohydrolase [Chitinispirillaceae bacterium]
MAFCYAQTYNIYYGDLHSHTGVSDGKGTPEGAFSQARDDGDADFLAVTDHSSFFDDRAWKSIADAAGKYTTTSFTALRGFELTESWAHMNIFNTDWYIKYATLEKAYDTLSKCKYAIAQWNHPDNYTSDCSPLSYYSPAADSVIHLLEIYNGKRARTRGWYFREYQAALDRGWHVGPSANSDNHCATWITGYQYRTAILATSVEKDSLYDAIRKYRTYATMDKNLKIYYSINGHIMGSIIPDSSVLMFRVVISNPDTANWLEKIKKIELISNYGHIVADTVPDAHNVVWERALDDHIQYINTFYYLKVSIDEDFAVTAPIWIRGDGQQPEKHQPLHHVKPNKTMLIDISGRVLAGGINSEMNYSRSLSSGIYFYANDAGSKVNMGKKYLHLNDLKK